MLRLASILVVCVLLWPASPARAQTPCPILIGAVMTAEWQPLCIAPQLVPAWNALVEPRPGDFGVEMGGIAQAAVARLSAPLIVDALPAGVAASYHASDNTIRVSPLTLSEDPRTIAASLLHEITHLMQVRDKGLGGPSDCVYMEAQAFAFQATFWASYWGTTPLPIRTESERELRTLVELLGTRGEPGFYELVVQNPGYQTSCDLWVPTNVAQPQPGQVAAPRPTPVPTPPPGPTPMQTAQCRKIAMDAVMPTAARAKSGKAVVAVQKELVENCQKAIRDYGDVGLYCFEFAVRQSFQSMQSGVYMSPELPFNYCVSAR